MNAGGSDKLTREQALEYMYNLMKWKQKRLPLIRVTDQGRECAHLRVFEGPLVHLINMWAPDDQPHEVRQYPTFEEVYDDGWRID
jgi:hypothetical protein